jgi:hypothetical protein
VEIGSNLLELAPLTVQEIRRLLKIFAPLPTLTVAFRMDRSSFLSERPVVQPLSVPASVFTLNFARKTRYKAVKDLYQNHQFYIFSPSQWQFSLTQNPVIHFVIFHIVLPSFHGTRYLAATSANKSIIVFAVHICSADLFQHSTLQQGISRQKKGLVDC